MTTHRNCIEITHTGNEEGLGHMVYLVAFLLTPMAIWNTITMSIFNALCNI